MADPLGSLCIVLHGHLPYVLNHGSRPHGEDWLYEAAAETYLPVLELLGECAVLNVRANLTIGLTPVLLEQLAHERFKTGFVAYLNERMDRARQDRREFEGRGDEHAAHLTARWEQWYARKLDFFERTGRDVPAEFAAWRRDGHVELLGGTATHAYLPLLLNDQMIRAQMSAGAATTAKRLGGPRPRGMWLPECAYRPASAHWLPAVLYDNPRSRGGVEHFVAEAGVVHFFVDSHLVANAKPLGVRDANGYGEMDDVRLFWDRKRGWGSPLEPVRVGDRGGDGDVFALARHPRVSEQVWSGVVGYPGSGPYLEFHRKHGDGGLRYHKVTSQRTPLSDKHHYYPDDAEQTAVGHAHHFCNVVRDALAGHRYLTGRQGVVVAPFDAELFGHWWFEGPRFLREVVTILASDPQVKLKTAEQALRDQPPDKVVRLPEGSWGQKGNHSVWLNEKTRWMWEMEYRAEGRFLELLHRVPWRTDADVAAMLTRAARELLLLQASDWPFVIHSGAAADYGVTRFAGHCTRFDRMATIADGLAHGRPVGDVERVQVAEADVHDGIFSEIELGWWWPR